MFLCRSDASIQRNGFSGTHSTVCGGMLAATVDKKHIYSHAKFGSSSYDNRFVDSIFFCSYFCDQPILGLIAIGQSKLLKAITSTCPFSLLILKTKKTADMTMSKYLVDWTRADPLMGDFVALE